MENRIITMTEENLKKMAIDFAFSSKMAKDLASNDPKMAIACMGMAMAFVEFMLGEKEEEN